MENTLENKAKFFAQYWRQEIQGYENTPHVFEVTENFTDTLDKGFLILKPLLSITDGDAKELAIIEHYEPKSIIRKPDRILVLLNHGWYDSSRLEIYHTTGFIEWDNMEAYEDNASKGVTTAAYDFLRSKGYALPYMGLSVEQLVEYGWVKLQN